MKIIDRSAARLIGSSLVLALLVSTCAAALPGPQDVGPNQEQQEGSATGQSSQAPPAASSPSTDALPDSPGARQPPAGQFVAQAEAPQPSPEPEQKERQKPVGTAAAETSTTTGFAASRPAGAALAPAKQKRARTLLISVGAVVGAAVALGTVMALSKGTPSKPPGSQ